MLERIQIIDNVGNYSRTRAGCFKFSKINIIYGENRNGKSTLCDIFYSLSLNDPTCILDRKSITTNQNSTQIQQLVELKFEGQTDTVKFSNSTWNSQPPEDSKLYIFDHSFIHRNVMTGSIYNRENSTNISGFILGESAEKFKELEIKNKKLRLDKKELAEYREQIETHNIGDFDTFINLPVPTITLAEFDSYLEESKAKQQSITTQITNIKQITQRANLESNIANNCDISCKIERINKCLASSMENVHEESKAIVDAHKSSIKDGDAFDGWIAKGLLHLNEDCPFCGQVLSDGAQRLIESYKTAFDNSFQRFVTDTKSTITHLLKDSFLNISLEELIQKHERNLTILNTYIENEVLEQLDKQNKYLSNCFEGIKSIVNEINNSLIGLMDIIHNALREKYDTPYNRIENIDFTLISSQIIEFNSLIPIYSKITTNINGILSDFKKNQNISILLKNIKQEKKKEDDIIIGRKRLNLNTLCVKYTLLNAQILQDIKQYDIDKKTLENDQESFLNTYFSKINELFRAIGSSDFAISRTINRGGVRTIYDLEVKFRDQLINNSKLNYLFSESDRRALALCIFLAKIYQLSDEEKRKSILIMDDPVTSFDNERISNILKMLFELKDSIKQIIITTHYKGMASAVMKKFTDVQALKIIRGAHGSNFVQTSKIEMTATAHDERYMEIMDFVNRITQENKITKLRPFIETEMRKRYKLPLQNLNLTDNDSFNDCIEALKNNQYIEDSVATSLHSYRTTLNLPAHELDSWSLEDSRSYAEEMMNFIYEYL